MKILCFPEEGEAGELGIVSSPCCSAYTCSLDSIIVVDSSGFLIFDDYSSTFNDFLLFKKINFGGIKLEPVGDILSLGLFNYLSFNLGVSRVV